MTAAKVSAGVLVALAVLAMSGAAFAQTTSASLSGTVVEASGAPAEGAIVQARSAETGAVRTTVTDGSGRYRFDPIPPGEWTVVARSSAGALSDSRTSTLRLQQSGRVDLAIGAGLKEEVVVEASVPLVDAQRTGGELRVSARQSDALPIAGRNVTDLALLDASIRPAAAGNYFGERGAVFVINGQTGRSNSFLVDGLDNNDQSSGTTLNAYFSPQVIREFVVQTHQFAPEFGRASGGVLNIVTNRGDNEGRGAWFGAGTTAGLNSQGALVATLPDTGEARRPWRLQSGFGYGGPISKDKAFYFVAFEHQSAEEVLAFTGVTRDGRAGGTTPAGNRDDNLFVRTDFNLDPANTLMVRVSADDRSTRQLNVGGVITPEAGFRVDERDVQLASSLTTVLSPRTVNELRLLAGTSKFDQSANSSGVGTERPSGIFGGNSLNRQLREESRFQLVDNLTHRRGAHTLKFGYDLTTSRTKLDVGFNPNGNLLFESDQPFEPGDCRDIVFNEVTFTCTGAPGRRCLRDSDCEGAGVCDMLPIPSNCGDSDGDGQVNEPGLLWTYPLYYSLIDGQPRATLSDTRIGVFAQDAWQINARVLVDYGVRYDLSTFRLPSGARVDTSVPNGGAGRDTDNWAPRLGFTWTPRGDGRLLVRGGAGVFYDKLVLAFPAVAAITSGTRIGFFPPMGTTVELDEAFVDTYGGDLLRQVLPFPRDLVLRFSTGTRLDTPYANVFNIGLEGSVGRNGAWSANLVRSLGYRLPLMRDLNPVVDTFDDATDPYPRDDGLPVHRTAGVGSIASVVTEGRSWYTGVDLTWKWQGEGAWHSVSYTWSRSEDLGPDPLKGGIYLPPRPALGDAGAYYESFAFERGRSDNDRRHRFVVAGEAPLPWMGLRLSGVGQYMSGAPFNVTTGRDENVDGITTDRPSGVGRNTGENTPLGPVNTLRERINQLLRLSGAEELAPVTSLREPAYIQVDLRLSRSFAYGGAGRGGEAYVQVFNVVNRFNAGPIDGRATTRNFGRPIGQVGPARTVELGLKLAL